MPISPVLESLDGLDEAVKSLYTEDDGKFHLDLDDSLKDHPSVAPLKRARDHEKAEAARFKAALSEAQEKLKAVPEDFSLEKWSKLKDGKIDEAAMAAERQRLEGERDGWKSKYEASEEKFLSTAKERDLTEALTAAGVTDAVLLKGARAILAPDVEIKDGVAVVDRGMGGVPLAEYAKQWAAGEGKSYVTPPTGGGAKPGPKGSGESNPWKSDGLNLTEQAKILKSDPERAARLKAEAGA